MMSYADDETQLQLDALEKKVAREYSRAYREMKTEADAYLAALKPRYDKEYTAMMASANSVEVFGKWYRQNRNKVATDAEIKAYWAKNQNTYTVNSFKLWYKTQVERGKRYEKLVDDVSKRVSSANEIAAAYINDKTPTIYSLNRNFTAYEISQMVPGTTFDIYNEQAVRNLIKNGKNVTEFRTVRTNPVRDYAWNSEQIRSAVTSGIIRGLSIDELSEAFLGVMQRNKAAAVRNARTAITGAQNAGRMATMDKASEMGIEVKKRWHSMEDPRVRFSHALLNGQIRDKNKPFSNGLMYPGDATGTPGEVYNCRCRMEYILPKYMDAKSNESYDTWAKLNAEGNEKDNFNKWQEEQLKMANYSNNGVDWRVSDKYVQTHTDEEIEELKQYVKSKGFILDNARKFDGDTELFKECIDALANVAEKHPTKPVMIQIVGFREADDFGEATEKAIKINHFALRNRKITEEMLTESGKTNTTKTKTPVFAAKTLEEIFIHEYGHYLHESKGSVNCLDLYKDLMYDNGIKINDVVEARKILTQTISLNAGKAYVYKKRFDFWEIPAEMLVLETRGDEMATKFIKLMEVKS